jgi:hypothetical protein
MEYKIKEMSIKQSIRRILREQNTFKETLIKTIDENGVYDTAKILGLTITKVVELSNIKITPEIANEILYENMRFNELKNTYKEFTISTNMDGVFYWQAQTRTGRFLPDMLELISVAATPFWDGSDYTPVEIDWFTLFDSDMNIIIETEGGGDYYQQLKHQTHFKNVKELLNWYEEFYLPEVYNLVMNTLLPEVHQDIDDKLDERGSY